MIGSVTVIEFVQESNDLLSVSFRIPIQQNQFTNNYRIEAKAVKIIFEKFGGKFSFYQENSNLCGRGYMNLEFIDTISVIPYEEQLIVNDFMGDLFEKRAGGKYVKLFIPRGRPYLMMPSAELADIVDSDIQFAELFLLGAESSI